MRSLWTVKVRARNQTIQVCQLVIVRLTRLTVIPRAATVLAVTNSQVSPLGTYLDWRPIPPRRQLLLTAGLLSPTLGFIRNAGWLALSWCGRPWSRGWKVKNRWKTKNPAGFLGEQGSRKSMIYGEIVNYLLASLVRFSFALTARWLDAGIPNPQSDFPIGTNIPAARRHAVVCECFRYVWEKVICFICYRY